MSDKNLDDLQSPTTTPVEEGTRPKVGDLVPQPGGRGALRYGNPGNKGGGRLPRRTEEAFKARMRRLASNPTTVRSLQNILRNDKHEHFPQVFKYVADHAFGKPVERKQVEHSRTYGPGDVMAALLGALSDPGVRDWLQRERPEVMTALAEAGAVLDGRVPLAQAPASVLQIFMPPVTAGDGEPDDGDSDEDPDAEGADTEEYDNT